MSRQLRVFTAVVASLLFPAAAFAHTAPAAHEHGLALGLIHPLTGLDHLLAMVAIGVWAARSAPKEVWIAPAFFVAGMSMGLLAGLPVMPSAGVEILIALSVAALGLLLAFPVKLPRWTTILLAAGAGLAHGAAHAAEGPIQAGFTEFATGALATTLMLHIFGAAGGFVTSRMSPSILRIAGVAMAVFGFGAALAAV
jgi:urease accessory protein